MFRIFDYINQHRTYVIAEMSANHGGSLDNAIRIVHEAKRAGADCLKIQTYTADTITINCKKEAFKCGEGLWENEYLYDLYQKAYTPWEWQPIIKKECEKVGIDFLSTPFDPTAVDFLDRYRNGICPVAEKLQPRMLQFKTNYWDWEEAEKQAEILKKTLTELD